MTSSPRAVLTLALGASFLLAACGKKSETVDEPTAAAAPAPAPAPAPPPAPTPAPAPATVEPSEEDRARAVKQAKLDYSTMEDGYINDARAQWATAAKASSGFSEVGDRMPKTPEASKAWRATGKIDGETWINNSQDIGFDWLELTYERPVAASELRLVGDGTTVESVSKLELIDTDGKAHTVWSGLSDVKPEKRGPRSWFVKSFEATPYKVQAVKVTMANNVSSGYKHVDAVQLVGD